MSKKEDIKAAETAVTEAKTLLAAACTDEEKAEAQAILDDATEKLEALKPTKPVKAAEVQDGYVKLKGGNCSCEGENYVSDKDGYVIVKAEHSGVLCRDFNFSRV